MLALLHHPRYLFDTEALSDHIFTDYPDPCGVRWGRAANFAPSGALQLAREGDKFIVSAALPGIKAEEISRIELVGNQQIHLEVKKTLKVDNPADFASANAGPAHAAPADAAPADQEEVVIVESKAAAESAVAEAPPASQESAPVEPQTHSIIVLDKTLTLPQPVAADGITCSYQDGLLRIEVPIVAPTIDSEHHDLVTALESEVKSAAAHVVELEQQLKEHKAKALEAQMALRSTQVGVHRAAQTRRHQLELA